MDLVVTCGSGLEPLLGEELAEMGFDKVTPGYRAVTVKSDLEGIYQINYNSRIATRVLLPLKNFRCFDAKGLYNEIRDFDWVPYIPAGKTFAIDPNVDHPQLRNSLYAAQVAKDAICDQFRAVTGERPTVSPKHPDIQLNLFIQGQKGAIAYDTSGASLTKRGYRIEAVEAPIHETLAAALLRLARYEKKEILCDPCCGSGTFLIEAALQAAQIPSGFLRTQWGFLTLPQHDASLWLKVKNRSDGKKIALPQGHFFGCDINRNAVRVTKVNLKAAGLQGAIDVVVNDFKSYNPPAQPTFFITNPPHGLRLEREDLLVPLYRALGDFFKQKGARPSKAFVFTGSLSLSKEVGLAATKKHLFDNSGIESRFLEYDIF